MLDQRVEVEGLMNSGLYVRDLYLQYKPVIPAECSAVMVLFIKQAKPLLQLLSD
jgi:hypothetical protein